MSAYNRNLKIGELKIFLILITIYLLYTIVFYIYNLIPNGILRAPDKPLILYAIKWIYAILLIIGILRLKYNSHLSYLLINTVSICILLFSFISIYYWFFYISFVDILLLEFISVTLIIVTNIKDFIERNNIKRRFFDLLIIAILPIIVTIMIKYLFEYFYCGQIF